VVWVGYQQWHGSPPAIELFNLIQDIAGHPRGSTVSRETLEAAGFYVPPIDDVARHASGSGRAPDGWRRRAS
jgi:hypothetical protein